MEIKQTARNFPYGEFTDRYGKKCSIQLSSLADDRCIWLGIDNAEPQILASLAANFGVKTEETTGWVDYPIPPHVSINTRMHLNIEQVEELIPILQRFVETGDIVEPQTI